ncbi:hypothetical protein G5T42_08580 [Microbacterium sp. 4R-513]|uniref:DUF7882 family protein n=1 Tax=Microbacterium sp. 4R-513 TaxID=2567934 RepID=UPI0013E1F136|nr:hypothetical protein [Microbacterium sp. 4R-513]QIG39536.1 hypothetical protein G5T42_08580 [Microbacterium sp. 4R-513]
MGCLYYGDDEHGIEVPDALLAHLKVVITTKLRRRESFTLTWRHDLAEPRGRSALWLQESIPLRFVFSREEPEQLQPALLQEFSRLANSTAGLTIDMNDWLEIERQAIPSAA